MDSGHEALFIHSEHRLHKNTPEYQHYIQLMTRCFTYTLGFDEVSMSTRTYSHKSLRKIQCGHLQSPRWQPTFCVASCLIWWLASWRSIMLSMTLNVLTETRHFKLKLKPYKWCSFVSDVPIWLKSLRLHKYAYLFQQMTYEEMLSRTEEWLEAQVCTFKAKKSMKLSCSIRILSD